MLNFKSGMGLGWVAAVLLAGAGVVAGVTLTATTNLTGRGEAASRARVSAPGALIQMSEGLADVAEGVIPSVVNISTTKTVKDTGLDPFFSDPFFRKFFGDPEGGKPREFKQRSLGSGVIVSADGYIVTNNHVVDSADEITVALSDNREFKGKVVGSDPRTDLAVIKIKADDLPAVRLADSDKLRPGEMVIAVGSPFGLKRTVTSGIISAVGRANVGIADYEDFIQTDAAINPGNSGGALVNVKGELVGVNTAIFSQSGGYQGVGFAVPSNIVKQVMDSLVKNGKVVRGWLGVSIQDLTPQLARRFGVKEAEGALVSDVTKDSPAEKAGVKMGDVIVAFDGRKVEDSGHLRNIVASTPVGAKVVVVVIRGGKKTDLDVVVEELPKGMSAKGGGAERPDTVSPLAGVTVQDLTPELRDKLGLDSSVSGVVVAALQEGSVAEDAGLQKGDVMMSVNMGAVKDVKAYNNVVSKLAKDEAVLLLIARQGGTFWMSMGPKEQ